MVAPAPDGAAALARVARAAAHAVAESRASSAGSRGCSAPPYELHNAATDAVVQQARDGARCSGRSTRATTLPHADDEVASSRNVIARAAARRDRADARHPPVDRRRAAAILMRSAPAASARCRSRSCSRSTRRRGRSTARSRLRRRPATVAGECLRARHAAVHLGGRAISAASIQPAAAAPRRWRLPAPALAAPATAAHAEPIPGTRSRRQGTIRCLVSRRRRARRSQVLAARSRRRPVHRSAARERPMLRDAGRRRQAARFELRGGTARCAVTCSGGVLYDPGTRLPVARARRWQDVAACARDTCTSRVPGMHVNEQPTRHGVASRAAALRASEAGRSRQKRLRCVRRRRGSCVRRRTLRSRTRAGRRPSRAGGSAAPRRRATSTAAGRGTAL